MELDEGQQPLPCSNRFIPKDGVHQMPIGEEVGVGQSLSAFSDKKYNGIPLKPSADTPLGICSFVAILNMVNYLLTILTNMNPHPWLRISYVHLLHMPLFRPVCSSCGRNECQNS